MGRKSPAKVIVEALSKVDVQDFLERQGLRASGNKPELVQRLLRRHGGDLAELMREGPWGIAEWNDFAEEVFLCPRVKSYAALAELLEAFVYPDTAAEFYERDSASDDEPEPASGVTPCPCRSGKSFSQCHGAPGGRRPDAPPHASRDTCGSGREPARPALHESEAWVLDTERLPWPPSLQQVRAARRSMAMFYHPDKHDGHPAAAEKMRLVNDGCDRLEARLAAEEYPVK